MKSINNFSLILFFLVFCSSFKILDPNSFHPLLSKISLKLDAINIDVIQDWQSSESSEGKPVLAPIANYPYTVIEKEDAWVRDFKEGYANGLIAIKTDVEIEEKYLLKNWNSTNIEKRIFISFNRIDAQLASNIKSILISEGYQVFIYFEENKNPICDPKTIAYFMKSAGEVLILDTKNSRTKPGVMAEALSFATYTYKSDYDLESENAKLLSDIEEKRQMIDNYFNAPEQFMNSIKDFNLKDSIVFDSDDDLQHHYNFNVKKTFDMARELLEVTNLDKEGLSNFTYNQKLKDLNIRLNLDICRKYKIPEKVCPVCVNIKNANCNDILNPSLVKKLIHK